MKPPYTIKATYPRTTGNPNSSLLNYEWYRALDSEKKYGLAEAWMLPFYPTEIHLHDAHSQLPDTIGGGENPCYSKKFRGLIEEFEPNHHQFLPVDIYSVDGVVLDKYYLFKSANILNDTVAPEKSEVKWRESKNFEGKTERYWSKIPLKPLAIKRNAIRGIHFWKETERILEFVSSDLHDAMVEQGLVGFKFEKQKLI